MVSRLTEQDQELLSAYLDGALSPADRASLESRLDAEPALRAELDSLRGFVQLMRAVPTLTPPRIFTLDPARHRRRPVIISRYVAMQWAGAIGALAAVLMIVMGLLLTGTRLMGAESALPAAALTTANAILRTNTQVAVAINATRAAAKDEATATQLTTATRVPATPSPSPSPTAKPQNAAVAPTPIPATMEMAATQLKSSGFPTPAPTMTNLNPPMPQASPGEQTGQADNGNSGNNSPAPLPTNGPAVADGAAEAVSATSTQIEGMQPVQSGGSAGSGAQTATPSMTFTATSTPTTAANSTGAAVMGTSTAAPLFAATTQATTSPSQTPSHTFTPTALPSNTPLPTTVPATTLAPGTKIAVQPTAAPTQTPIRAGETEDSAANVSRLLLISGITLLLLSGGAFAVGWFRRQSG